MTEFVIYWRKLGGHIHMKMFAHNKGKLGDLVCRDEEFRDLRNAMTYVTFIEQEEQQSD